MAEDSFEDPVTIRLVSPNDREFLERLYASTRGEELAMLGWTKEQESAFFEMQFDLQSRAYAMQFPDAVTYIVEHDRNLVGRMIVERRDDELRVIDISLVAEFRGLGIGAHVLEGLKSASKAVILRVLKTNPRARRFYDKHGFETVEDADLHWTMRWKA